MSEKVERVNHPKHYNLNPSGIECIDVVEWMSFNIGNAVKYLWRCESKDNEKEDLEKAIWYINREIQRIEKNKKKEDVNVVNSEGLHKVKY